MEAVVFCGLQAAGKSTFYKARFADSHVRINLDMLRTRHRERCLLDACLEAGIPFVVDNTNPTPEDRARYLMPARRAGFRTEGYYFSASMSAVLARNAQRTDKSPVPEAGLRGTSSRLVVPEPKEGFDRLWRVLLDARQGFRVSAF